MFLVDGFCEPSEITLVYRDGVPSHFRYVGDNDYYNHHDDYKYFKTKEEADKYASDLMPVSDELIKKYIEHKYANGELEGVLSRDIYDYYIAGQKSYLHADYAQREQLENALRGILNIDAYSFRTTDVEMVKFGKDWCYLVLKNGTEINVNNDVEFFIIKSIFGSNNSERVFTNIKRPKQ